MRGFDTPLRIVSETVVNSKGEVIGNDPSQFPRITNLCLQITATLETGRQYRIVDKKEETA
jgi:hypothetical protein